MDNNVIMSLVNEAKKVARHNKCCKYSKFTVGAAVLCSNGKVYTGCNIENHGLMSICAERLCLSKALSEDETDFICIAIVGKNLTDEFFKETLPCGYCRQFMSEYCGRDFKIYTYDEENNVLNIHSLEELLPYAFNFKED